MLALPTANTNNKQINFIKLARDIQKIYHTTNYTEIEFSKILNYNYIKCKDYNCDFALQLSKISIESSFNQRAISSSSCVGLHQISSIVCIEYNVSYWKVKSDPYLNSAIGIRYFAYLMKLTNNNINKSLKFYNVGPNSNLLTYLSCDYDNRVLAKYDFFNSLIDKNSN